MHCCRFNFGGRGLQVEQGAAATGASHVVGFENPRARCLQDVVAQSQRLSRRFLALHEDRVADSITKERPDVGRGDEQGMKE